MEQFKLKTGTVEVQGQRLIIQGDHAKRNKLLMLAVTALFSGFIMKRLWELFQEYQHNSTSFVVSTMGILVIALFLWLYLGYLRIVRTSAAQEIEMEQVYRATTRKRPADKAPIVTLFLKNQRRRELIFTPVSIQSFAQWLSAQVFMYRVKCTAK